MSNYPDQSTEQLTQPLDGSEQVPPQVRLPRPPLYTDDYITMAEALEFMMERFGKLVLAIMYYTASGTVPNDLPPDLKVMFSIYQKKIDFAREKYERKCATNAKNGAKGGKAKAENVPKKSAETKFSPPAQKQFRDAVEHFVNEGEIAEEPTAYDVDSFFDELQDSGWTIGGAPIQSRADWEAATTAKFYQWDSTLPAHLYYAIFSAVFADFHATGEEADNATYEFTETYDEASRCWIVQGENFKASDWKNALAQFMKQRSECSDT